jgi:hypothetical protein
MLCAEIIKTNSYKQKKEYHFKIMDILKKASLTSLRGELGQERVCGKEVFAELKPNKMWNKLSAKKKEFCNRVADLKFLNTDYDKTQKFYDERIEKIKNDSSLYFNQFTIN